MIDFNDNKQYWMQFLAGQNVSQYGKNDSSSSNGSTNNILDI